MHDSSFSVSEVWAVPLVSATPPFLGVRGYLMIRSSRFEPWDTKVLTCRSYITQPVLYTAVNWPNDVATLGTFPSLRQIKCLHVLWNTVR